jgi:hypothetical protein
MTKMPINRLATISLVCAILTLVFFCIGTIPIPLTAIPCYPSSALMGFLSFVLGVIALFQIRLSGQAGAPRAIIAIVLGLVAICAVLLMTSLTLFTMLGVAELIQQNINLPTPAP